MNSSIERIAVTASNLNTCLFRTEQNINYLSFTPRTEHQSHFLKLFTFSNLNIRLSRPEQNINLTFSNFSPFQTLIFVFHAQNRTSISPFSLPHKPWNPVDSKIVEHPIIGPLHHLVWTRRSANKDLLCIFIFSMLVRLCHLENT